MSARLRVAYQGEPGAFGEDAVLRFFGALAEPVPMPTFAEVAGAVASGTVDRAVIPTHNTIAGAVSAGVAAIQARDDLEVVGALEVPVRLCLIGVTGTRLVDLREAHSHPVALAQCGRFLSAHPAISPVAEYDTAGAVRLVHERNDGRIAALASRRAAELHGLTVLASDIQDLEDNRTSFSVLAAHAASP